jgi:hypothetical protein
MQLANVHYQPINLQAEPQVRFPADGTELLFCGAAVLIGLTNAFTIRLVGLMPVSEIFLLAFAAYASLCLLLNRRLPAPLLANRFFGFLLVCQAIAFAGYLIADFYRDSAPGDAFRGWARMVFLAVDISSIGLLFGKSPRVFTAYLAGVVLSASSVLFSVPLFGDYWKFGYGYPLTILVLILAPSMGGPATILAALGIGVAHYFMDYRSMALVCWLVAALALLNQFSARWRRGILIAGALSLAVIVPVIMTKMGGSHSSRHGRSNAERSAMIQAAAEAIVASPFFGHGSWFSRTNVMDEFVEIRTENARLAGVGGFDETKGDNMAIHSQILVSMAEGGILGGAFFIAYGCTLLWALYVCTVVREWDYFSAGYLVILVSSSFALCFSPFSGSARVEIAATTGVVLLLWRERRTAHLHSFFAPIQGDESVAPIHPAHVFPRG